MPVSGFLPRAELPSLLAVLQRAGYQVLGPQVRDGAIVYDRLQHVDQLPFGVRDRQSPGAYRLEAVTSPRRFAWANGPQALKPLLFVPRERLWRAERGPDGVLSFIEAAVEAPALAVLGVRACDLAALALHDRHFLHGAASDPHYAARREQMLLIAVHCTHSADTCFCASTGDGPRATSGFDLALSELDDGFLVETGSEAGERIAAQLPLEMASADQQRTAAAEVEAAAAVQTRRLPGGALRDTLFARLEHPRWEAVAERCLSCGNCTSVCPTCFCSREQEDASLDGRTSEHVRDWDSCFSQQHSYIHGITIRSGTRERYRQWLTHKLAGWHDQFGRSGCVGCGRCITWCPVGIDLTEEAAAIAAD
jgi:ferredoxin